MKVCLIGDGLVSLTLANVLIQKDLFVDIYSVKKNNFNDQSRTLGISKSNIDFFNNEIMNIEKILWNIQKIKIFTDKNKKKELLKFDNKSNQIFSIINILCLYAINSFFTRLFIRLQMTYKVMTYNISQIFFV